MRNARVDLARMKQFGWLRVAEWLEKHCGPGPTVEVDLDTLGPVYREAAEKFATPVEEPPAPPPEPQSDGPTLAEIERKLIKESMEAGRLLREAEAVAAKHPEYFVGEIGQKNAELCVQWIQQKGYEMSGPAMEAAISFLGPNGSNQLQPVNPPAPPKPKPEPKLDLLPNGEPRLSLTRTTPEMLRAASKAQVEDFRDRLRAQQQKATA